MPFASIRGHRESLRLLSLAVSRGTLPPSLLFAGPEGVGKLRVAVALAQAMNCERPVTGAAESGLALDACGTCPTCARIARAEVKLREGATAALDCFVALVPDEKRSIKVDPTRAFIERTGYRPLDGRRRLAVVDEAEQLEVGAQNALLKVLEEPPPGTAFVLVTSRPDALLQTIRSRCPRVRFGTLPTADVAAVLAERHGMSEPEARAAAALGAGSPGAALSLASGRTRESRAVALATLRAASSARGPSMRLSAAKTLVGKAEAETGRKKGGDGVSRAVLADRLESLGALLRDVQVLSSRADDRWLTSADLADDLAGLAREYDGRRAGRAFTAVDRALAALERNASPKVVADWLALQL
jgi:DNA polymerase-3 subunit delta'